MRSISLVFCGFFLCLSLLSCQKPEGIGGIALLKGKVHMRDYNNSGVLIDEYDVPDERVYLIYGESDSLYDDDTRTNFNGDYQFEYLYPGKYTVYTYEYCDTCSAGIRPVFVTIDIPARTKEVSAPTLYLKK